MEKNADDPRGIFNWQPDSLSWVIPSEWVFLGGMQLDFYHLQRFSQTNSTATAGTGMTNSCKYYLMQTPCLFISPPCFTLPLPVFALPVSFFLLSADCFMYHNVAANTCRCFYCVLDDFSQEQVNHARRLFPARRDKPKGFTIFKQVDNIIRQPL